MGAPLAAARTALRSFSTCASVAKKGGAVSTAQDLPVSALADKIQPKTFQALTQGPFHLATLTEVQREVFSLLPEVAFGGLVKTSEPLADGEGRDLLVKARTGTGKTLGFLVPATEARRNAWTALRSGTVPEAFARYVSKHEDPKLLEARTAEQLAKLRTIFQRRAVGTLIVSPTRELASQIAAEAKKLLSHQSNVGVQLFVGGESPRMQRRTWQTTPRDVVVATPGRLLDMLQDEKLADAIGTTQTLVLDEADMLLEMGFREDIQKIINYLPSTDERATMLFSATVNKNIERIARATLHPNHRFIDCVPPGEDNVHTRIPQYVTTIADAADLLPHVLRLIARDQLEHGAKSKVMLFCPTTKVTQALSLQLQEVRAQLPAENETMVFDIHSGREQAQRSKISQRFRMCKANPSVMVTSDVSARGVDYPGVTQVIQLGIPSSKELYVHRVGRTGRGGSDGRSDLVASDFESGFVTFELQDMPLQPLAADKLAAEVTRMAEALDAEPKRPRAKLFRGKKRTEVPVQLQDYCPAAPRLTDEVLREAVDEARYSLLDEPTSRRMFTSLLGFYMSHIQELRTNKRHLLDAISEWMVGTSGLTERPTLSSFALQQMGIFGGPNKDRGKDRGRARPRSDRAPRKSFAKRGKDRW